MVRAPLIHAQEATWSCRRGLADHANIYRKTMGPKDRLGFCIKAMEPFVAAAPRWRHQQLK